MSNRLFAQLTIHLPVITYTAQILKLYHMEFMPTNVSIPLLSMVIVLS